MGSSCGLFGIRFLFPVLFLFPVCVSAREWWLTVIVVVMDGKQ